MNSARTPDVTHTVSTHLEQLDVGRRVFLKEEGGAGKGGVQFATLLWKQDNRGDLDYFHH